MKGICFIFIFIFLTSFEISANDEVKEKLDEIFITFKEGKYQTTARKLNKLLNLKLDRKTRGLIHYWLGMSHNRNQEYKKAIRSFRRSMRAKYKAPDLYYELAQSLFASERLKEAKIYFNESFKSGFKMGTSLYYMAYISNELNEKDNAKSLFQVIEKLPPEESREVLQAAKFQLTDIELEEAETHPQSIRIIESEIIPKYKKVIKVDPDSYLVPKISKKILEIQKKYQLILFKLRNGLPTILPRHFLRIAQEAGFDTNVVYAPSETTLTKTELESPFSKTEALGRYTFYPSDMFSISPELRLTYTRFFNRAENILKNDNLLIAPILRNTFEHTLFNKPASALLDYEFNQVERDINGENTLNFASRSHSIGIGERFNFLNLGASTIRLKMRLFESYLEDSNSTNLGLVYEQTLNLDKGTFLLFTSYDQTRVKTDTFDSNSFTLRGDYLFPALKNWNPSLGLALTFTDPINNRSERGLEKLINPGLRLNRRIGKNWGANFRYEYYNNISKDKENFGYRKNLFGLELDYIF